MRLIGLAVLPLLFWLAEPVTPGDPLLDPSLIHLGTDSLVVLVKQGSQLGYGGLMVLETRGGGDEPITRRETLVGPDRAVSSVDSFSLDARTLALVRTDGDGTGQAEAFHANSFDLVLAALPLADGFAADVALDSTETEPASVARVRVLGVEDVNLVTRELCPSWKVEVVIGERPGLYMISQETRRLMRFFAPLEGVLITSGRRTCSG